VAEAGRSDWNLIFRRRLGTMQRWIDWAHGVGQCRLNWFRGQGNTEAHQESSQLGLYTLHLHN
jgi:hypothetical protein